MRTRTLFASLALLTLVAGCSDTRSATMVIPAATGGTVTAGAVSITIPANSLAADTDVSLSEVSLAELALALEDAQSTAFRLDPEGTVLELPATVVIDGSAIDGTAEANVAVHQLVSADGTRWVRMESSRNAAGAVSVSVTRLAPLGLVVVEPGTAGTVRGVLRWGDASAVDGAPIELWLGDTQIGTSTTDATGAFMFGDLEAGSYEIRLDYECTLMESVSVGPGQTVELTLTLCG